MLGASDALIEFRTAYLRAVALVWRKGTADPADPDVQSLLDPSQNALTKMNALFGCDVPWNMWVRLSWDPDPNKRPQWRPRLSGGWVGGDRHHRITVYTPDVECLPNEQSAVQALAGYYAVSPTPFGRKPPPVIDQTFDVHLGSITTFEEFGGVFIRMLGLLWRSGEDGALAGFATEFFGPAPDLAFQRWVGYRWQWNIDLSFVRCLPTVLPNVRYCMRWTAPPRTSPHGAGWEFAEVIAGTRGPWQNGLPPNELELSIPHYPVLEEDRSVRDVEIEPLALAAYNETGKPYPLTCCAC